MLILRKSRRTSERFESRFRDGSGSNFPLRQYLRCREDLSSGIIHMLLLVTFAGVLVVFARTVNTLFLQHGADLSPWVRYVAVGLVLVLVLVLVRRAFRRFVELRETWGEMRQLRSELGRVPDEPREPDPESAPRDG
jgi:predicted membrane chloride channel (bestrophin family)